MLKICFTFVLAVSFHAHAKETWFGITGINPNNKAQNYADYYAESNAFLAACKRNPARDCRRYINPETKLVANGTASVVGENRGTPYAKHNTDKGILKEIKNVIKNAKAGDQIVISLSNHGGPGWDKGKKDTACIFLAGAKQKICDSDLKRIIGDLPKKRGFKVMVVADGCFSGGFNTLASKDVCVVSSADQMRAGYGGRFWESVKERSPATLAEAGAAYNSNGNPYDHTMLASEYMENQGCYESQKFVNDPVPDLLTLSPMRFGEDQLCADNSGYRQLNQLTVSMNDVVTKVSDIGTVRKICAVSAEWCNTIQNVSRNQNAFLQTREYSTLLTQIAALQNSMNSRIADLYTGLSSHEMREVSAFVNYGDSSALDRLPAHRQPALRQAAAQYSNFAAANKPEIDRLFARMSGMIKEWQASPIAADLRKLQACLSTPMQPYAKSALIKELESQAQSRRKLQFTNQNKLDARQCEQSFRL